MILLTVFVITKIMLKLIITIPIITKANVNIRNLEAAITIRVMIEIMIMKIDKDETKKDEFNIFKNVNGCLKTKKIVK